MFSTSEKWSYGKLRHPWRENWPAAFLFSRCRKGLWTSVQLTILLQSKKTNVKATLQNTQRDVKLLQTLLGTRNELRKVEEIPAVELNEYICEFIISVRAKDYEPCLLRSLLASFERHLKENSYSASIMNDLVFEKTRKVLLSKQKELKKKEKENRTNASIALKGVSHFIVLSLSIVIIVWVKSHYLWNKQITSWLVSAYDFYSLVVKNRKLTRSKTRSFVCDSSQLVNKNRTHSPTMK